MHKRTNIPKSLRFEVFKRDKFTCQYCGRKAPDVVLNVDHIEPVSQGGSNEIINLITSCFDCNNGKRDKRLDDNSVIEKQRRQLELLQERREQMELMIEWKKSLSNFDEDIVNMVIDYIEEKICPYYLNATGKIKIKNLFKKYPMNQLLDTIDETATKCIVFDENGAEKKSVEFFINQLPRYIATKNMPPIKQKLAYIKGICRNRFNYWDAKKGTAILSNYVQALKDYGWSDTQIIDNLETDVIKRTKESTNWTQWKSLIERLTESIKNWEKTQSETHSHLNKRKISHEEIENDALRDIAFVEDKIEILIYLAKAFPNFSDNAVENLKKGLYTLILECLHTLKNKYQNEKTYLDDKFLDAFFDNYDIPYLFINKHFNLPLDPDDFGQDYQPLSWGALEYINNTDLIDHIIKDILRMAYPMTNYNYESILRYFDYMINHYSNI